MVPGPFPNGDYGLTATGYPAGHRGIPGNGVPVHLQNP